MASYGFTEKLYCASPVWIQHLLVSGKGFGRRYLRTSNRIMRNQFHFLLQSQYWPIETHRHHQVAQLQDLLRTAFKHVPYYRELQRRLGCKPEDFNAPEDIRFLPMLDKSQVRGQERLFLNETVNLRACSRGFTSGTTGTSLTLYESRESFSRRLAFVARLRRWAGIADALYPRRARFSGRDIVPVIQGPDMPVYWRWDRPGNALLFSTTHLSEQTIPYYAAALSRYAPELIEGHPSAMLIVARVAHRLGLNLPRPDAIIVTAETLLPEQRFELERAFGCKVYNQYAASEPSCFWGDCEHGVMHTSPEYGISEIIAAGGNPAEPGEPGEVVVTSFLNRVMILIRYRLGDVAAPSPKTGCECGRNGPLIDRVEGRVDDIIYIPQQGYVGRLNPVFMGLNGVIEAQIIQEDLSHIRVLLVPDSGYDHEVEKQLLHNLRARIGHSVEITVDKVLQVPRGPNGKFRTVISKVKDLFPDRM